MDSWYKNNFSSFFGVLSVSFSSLSISTSSTYINGSFDKAFNRMVADSRQKALEMRRNNKLEKIVFNVSF